MFSSIEPGQYVALRLPTDAIKIQLIQPNTVVSLGKYGSFQANQILGRPYYLTFEILDRSDVVHGRELRIVPAAELHADALISESDTPALGEDDLTPASDHEPDDYERLTGSKTNQNILDDPANQRLTMAEIEALKRDETGTSKEIIAKILQSHSTIDQKTAFSLAKYTLRKHQKYLKRFSVLPLDVVTMTDWLMKERDFAKVMELRNEALGLIGCWANVHASGVDPLNDTESSGRYLVVDDTGGLVIAGMAERMGILYPPSPSANTAELDTAHPSNPDVLHMSATSSTLTLIHTASQPNLALLRYFGYNSSLPDPTHPLHAHLHTLSFLTLLQPDLDPLTHEPPLISAADLANLKSSKRATYYRKRRRWSRITRILAATQAGEFDALIVASFTDPASILQHLVPLCRGGAQVIVYSPNIEPLIELSDAYSTARRTAFLNLAPGDAQTRMIDFPLDPTLLLAPLLQTARVRRWQVLPGRTHPLMMGRGGAEGYVWSSTRVLPITGEGRVEARGKAARGRGQKDLTRAPDTAKPTFDGASTYLEAALGEMDTSGDYVVAGEPDHSSTTPTD